MARALEGGGGIALTWQPARSAPPAARYEVTAGGRVVATASTPAAEITGLAPGREHCFAVVALDAAGERSPPSPPACASVPDVTPPTTPTDLVAEAAGVDVQLRWSPSTDDVGVVSYEVLRAGAVVATTSGTTATESGVKAAVSHCYSVRAVDGAGNRSPPSAQACVTPPDVTPPSEPVALQASSPSETDVVLSWGPATDDVGVTGYEVFRGDALAVRATGTRAGDAGLKAGTTYCYRVRAMDAAGNRGPFAPEACVTTLDLTPPTAPTSLVAEPDGQTQVRVRWAPSTDNVGVTRYEVRREGKVVGSVPGTSSVEGKLAEGRFYCYAVTAFDKAGNASPATGPACTTIPDRTPPSVPEALRSAATSDTKVSLAWLPSTDNVAVAGYEVLSKGAVVHQGGQPRAIVGRLAPDTAYCFTVRAQDVSGNRSAESAESCVRTAKEDSVVAPTNLEARAKGDSEIALRWDPSPGSGVIYLVSWEGDDAAAPTTGGRRVGATRGTTMRVTGKFAREHRCYTVAAQDADSRVSARSLAACTDDAN